MRLTVAPSNRPVGLKQRSVVLMIVLTAVTLGLYYPIWFLYRTDSERRPAN